MIVIYITNPDKKTAVKIAQHLLRKKIIACANFFPIEASYWWQNKICQAKEVVLLDKTTDKFWLTVQKEVKKIHPYKIPCILKLKVQANKDFSQWLNEVMS